MEKRVFALVGAIITVVLQAFSYDFIADGICYNILSDSDTPEVEVTFKDSGESNADFYYGNITIPASVSQGNVTYRVTRIGYRSFANCTGLTGIIIPESVTVIDFAAFKRCI